MTLLILLSGVSAPAAPVMTAEKVTARVQKLYDGTKDFSAEFTQDYEMVALGRSQQSKGKVMFKKPGKIRFDYQEPQSKTFAVDGSTLWIFQAQDKQALVDKCFKADGLTASLVFLGGAGKIGRIFTTALEAGDATSYALRLTPKEPQAAFKSILLWVDKKSFEVTRTEVEDQTGNPNRFTFSDVKRNKGVKSTEVVFAPPPDVTVSPVPGSCDAAPSLK